MLKSKTRKKWAAEKMQIIFKNSSYKYQSLLPLPMSENLKSALSHSKLKKK